MKMKLFTLVFAFVSMSLNAYGQIKCAPAQDLKSVKPEQLKSPEAKSYAQQIIDESKAQQAGVDKLNKTIGRNAYSVYFDSTEGKRSAAKITELKEKIKYDAISYYLFDNPSFNADVEAYDTTVVEGKKTFYIKDQRVIAILSPAEGNSWILRRFDADCKQKEAVGFASLDPASDGGLSYKINSGFCNLLKNKKKFSALSEDDLDRVKAMINSAEDDKETLRKWNNQVQGQCRSMETASAGARKRKKSGSGAVSTGR